MTHARRYVIAAYSRRAFGHYLCLWPERTPRDRAARITSGVNYIRRATADHSASGNNAMPIEIIAPKAKIVISDRLT